MDSELYLKRDQDNQIIALSKIKLEGFSKVSESDMSDVYAFLNADNANETKHTKLLASDLEIIRVLEDLIEILIDKNIIQLTELPSAAQEKLLSRKKVRSTISDFLSPDSEIEFNDNIDV